MSITAPLREIHRILDEAHESTIRVNDLYDLLDQPSDISFAPGAHASEKPVLDADAIINVSDLDFSYQSEEETGVLHDIRFSIRKGEKIGIAGASGCGKSTLVKILLRLVHGYSGAIEIFGRDLKTVTRGEIAEKIAYIPQKTYIFSGTIADNIVYGSSRKNISGGDWSSRSRRQSIRRNKNSLGGLSGKVLENGNNLSGGQRQRLTIARLALRSPEILIFDEATSALDNSNEVTIQKKYREVVQRENDAHHRSPAHDAQELR